MFLSGLRPYNGSNVKITRNNLISYLRGGGGEHIIQGVRWMNVQGNRSLALLLALVLFLAAGVTGRAAGQSDTLQEAFQNALDRYNAANQSALVIILSGQA